MDQENIDRRYFNNQPVPFTRSEEIMDLEKRAKIQQLSKEEAEVLSGFVVIESACL